MRWFFLVHECFCSAVSGYLYLRLPLPPRARACAPFLNLQILKKHDKLTQHETRRRYMNNRVHKHPFSSYARLSDALRDTETLFRALTSAQLASASSLDGAGNQKQGLVARSAHRDGGREDHETPIAGAGAGAGVAPCGRLRLPTEDEASLTRIESMRAHSAATFAQGQQELRAAAAAAAATAVVASATKITLNDAGRVSTTAAAALKRQLGAQLQGEASPQDAQVAKRQR